MSSALKEITRSGVVWLVGFLFGEYFMVNGAPGGEASANPQFQQVQIIQLEYGEAGYGVINESLPVVTRSIPFAKEPALTGNKVVRGAFSPAVARAIPSLLAGTAARENFISTSITTRI